jgi:hypothetical protein
LLSNIKKVCIFDPSNKLKTITMTPINKKILFAIVSVIETLENKREDGTITMTEEAILCSLVEKAEYILSL